MPLTTIPETYLAGMNATITVGGTAACVEDGSYRTEVKVDEKTNTCGGGYYEDVAGPKKFSGNFRIAWKPGAPLRLTVGTIYPIVMQTQIGGPYLSGGMRVASADTPILNVQGGITQTVNWTNQGLMTETNPLG